MMPRLESSYEKSHMDLSRSLLITCFRNTSGLFFGERGRSRFSTSAITRWDGYRPLILRLGRVQGRPAT